MNAFDHTLPALGGGTLTLSDFRGRPMLIANTASKCGFTPQYAGLQALWERYAPLGLVVIGVPSNDFGRQEPGAEAEIVAFCSRNYGVSFPMAGKVHVRGGGAHPLFRAFGDAGGLLSRPRWNFYKYLVGPDGRLETWFSSVTAPGAGRVHAAVERILLA